MPSFDIVSKVETAELTNTVDQVSREIGTRYDFKGTSAKIERLENMVTLYADSEFQLKQVQDILYQRAAKRGIDVASFDPQKIEAIGGDKAKQVINVKQGVDKELARKIVKLIKDSGLKVQAAIQGEEVRVSGKKRDDLQAAIALVRGAKLDQPLQFTNFRD
ncbi:MAG TPA: YajQ family cyclic di-GMP-binding protein [Gammaproteobacteria bacterium]|nr:YajQ family cyclic di-GMP-binding protein [Gammaproteobacteria bacterium]